MKTQIAAVYEGNKHLSVKLVITAVPKRIT